MSKLHVGKQELRSSYRRKRAVIRGLPQTDPTALLLWCYAIECGLKLVLLNKRQLHHTSQFGDDDLTHDLNSIQKKLGQSPTFQSMPTEKPPGISVGSNTYHQLFRYGGRLSPTNHERLQNQFSEVAAWIDEQI